MLQEVLSHTEPHVLIVANDPYGLTLVVRYLEPEGFVLYFARDVGEAQEKACNLAFDLVLLDIPGAASEVSVYYERIRDAAPRLAEVPSILLVTQPHLEQLRGFEGGTVDYIIKPIRRSELLARLNLHLSLQAARKSLLKSNRQLQREIQKHKAMEQSLRESQVLFEAVFDSAAVCICILDINGGYLKANHTCEEMLGYTIREMLYLECFHLIHPQHCAQVRAAMTGMQRGESRLYHQDIRLRHHAGHYFWGSYWLTPLFDHEERCSAFVCMITDLTARRRSEAELRKLSRAVEQSHNSIVITDLEGRIEFVNPAFSESTGYSAAETIGQNPRILKSGQHSQAFYRVLWDTLKNGQAWRGELINRRKNGELYSELATIFPIKDEHGQSTHYVAVKEDITQLKKAEAELTTARQAAEQANQAKSHFLASMSHEIRTPMNAIIGFTDMLDELIDDPRQLDYVHLIRRSGRSLLKLIDDILDLSRVEAGKLTLEYGPVDLAGVFHDMPALFAPKLKEREVELQLEVAEELPPAVFLDETRIRQILINLIGNAIKFTAQGYVKLSAWYIGPHPDHEHIGLGFCVEDSGIGIPQDQWEKVFNAFEQQAGQKNSEFGGSGLGLSITKRLVELMGGSITLNSEVERGASFTIQFPGLELPILLGNEISLYYSTSLPNLCFTPFSVLYADANVLNHTLLRQALKGYNLDLAYTQPATLSELLEQARSLEPAVILCNSNMGESFLSALKDDNKIAEIPLVVLGTSNYSEELSARCEAWLCKPVPLHSLLDNLMRFIQHSLDLTSPTEKGAAALPAELQRRLQEEFIPRWRQLNENSPFNAIEAFGREIQTLAQEHDWKTLAEWGESLYLQALNFDVVHVFETLEQFEQFIGRDNI